jgi:hypothetical protein
VGGFLIWGRFHILWLSNFEKIAGTAYFFERTFSANVNSDALVKSIQMAKIKVPYTRRSDFSDKKTYM